MACPSKVSEVKTSRQRTVISIIWSCITSFQQSLNCQCVDKPHRDITACNVGDFKRLVSKVSKAPHIVLEIATVP